MLLGPEPDGAAQLVTEYPALKSVFFRPFVLVYGTQGETHQQEMLLHQANQIAIRFWRSANGYVRVMADTEVTKSIESDFNLVMLGNPESNLMIKKLLPHTPLEFTENGLRLEGKEYFGELAVSIMYPLKWRDGTYISCRSILGQVLRTSLFLIKQFVNLVGGVCAALVSLISQTDFPEIKFYVFSFLSFTTCSHNQNL